MYLRVPPLSQSRRYARFINQKPKKNLKAMTNIFGYQQSQMANVVAQSPVPPATTRPSVPWESLGPPTTALYPCPPSMCIFKATLHPHIHTYIHAFGGVHGLPGSGFWRLSAREGGMLSAERGSGAASGGRLGERNNEHGGMRTKVRGLMLQRYTVRKS